MTGTYAAAVQRILIGRVVATIGAMVALLGTFLPWVRSGQRRRSSYEIFSLVDRLGISRSSVVGWGLRMWPVVPLLLALSVTLLWFARRSLAAAIVAVTVVYAGVVAAAVRSARSTSLVTVENGPMINLLGLAVLVAGSALSLSNRPLPNRQ
ncbi:MAG: hypothetical protein QOE09_1859 [Ilumatobacteraceae bacterium]|jgi:hypothetical protein